MKKIFFIILLFFLFAKPIPAQEDLLASLDSTQVQDTYATAAFKGLQM